MKYEITSQIALRVNVQSCSQAVPSARPAVENRDSLLGPLFSGGPPLSGRPLLSGGPLLSGRPLLSEGA